MKDIVIIGGGPGGYVAAIRAAQLGAKVAVVEKEEYGGTCLNKGCIPTKALFKNAEVIHTMQGLEEFGISIDGYSIDIEKIHQRKEKVVHQLVDGVKKILASYDVEMIIGKASIKSNKEVLVGMASGEDVILETKNILIATGAVPNVPEEYQMDHPGLMTSDDLINFRKIPESLIVIGGGVIGMEFATIFNAMGTKVEVIERGPRILSRLDSDLSKRLQALLKKKGMIIHNHSTVKEIRKADDGNLIMELDKKGKDVTLNTEKILVSVGRRPQLKGLNLDEMGVKYTKKGIDVDENYETNVEGIYAIGDVIGRTMLAHEASHQGIIAAEAVLNRRITKEGTVIPSCIFTYPEVATVGLSEEEAKAKKLDYRTSKFMFGGNGKALAMGDTDGFIKVVANGDTIVGVHIMGHNASDLIHEGILAVSRGMRIDDITGTVHAHPTLSEGFAEAVLGLKGESIHAMASKNAK